MRTIGLACDHAGYQLKKFILELLKNKGYEVKDYGTYSDLSCDYPDFAHALAAGISNEEVFSGIAICGSGAGICMTLNKHQEIRAAVAWSSEIAQLIRQHNDANVLVLPGRFVDNKTASNIIDNFLNTTFEGGRHQKRIEKIPIR